ncbi:four helix bundle protein [Salinibacter altiplanensis]|uniref:four helix bundle protein n=1 Tax=Salinibacter altiplanensis TaxID=1803181 RepID=UPI000C9F6AE3|nr:four helix bundle protein [Salinibacter altiplanensis]
MPKIERFEDLRCWKKARELTSEVYDLIKESGVSNDYRLRDQLTGAAVSTMSNIAEGFARYNKKDFIRFLDYEQSSAAEVKSLSYVVLDQDVGYRERVEEIQEDSEVCQRMILSLLKHVRSTIPNSSGEAKEPTLPFETDGGFTPEWSLPDRHVDIGSSSPERE